MTLSALSKRTVRNRAVLDGTTASHIDGRAIASRLLREAGASRVPLRSRLLSRQVHQPRESQDSASERGAQAQNALSAVQEDAPAASGLKYHKGCVNLDRGLKYDSDTARTVFVRLTAPLAVNPEQKKEEAMEFPLHASLLDQSDPDGFLTAIQTVEWRSKPQPTRGVFDFSHFQGHRGPAEREVCCG